MPGHKKAVWTLEPDDLENLHYPQKQQMLKPKQQYNIAVTFQ